MATPPIPRSSIRTSLRISAMALLTAFLLVVAGEHQRSTVDAGAAYLNRNGPRNLYVLSIGIDVLPKAPDFPKLDFAVADARSVAAVFSTKEVANTFVKVEVTTLLDSAATLSGIRTALEHLVAVCKPEDVVVFYFAGDGALLRLSAEKSATSKIASEFNFVLYDSSMEGNAPPSLGNTLTGRELSLLLLSIQAQRQIIILDSSHSAAAFDSLNAALNSDSVFTLRNTGRRFALLGIDGDAKELQGLGHGLMTSTLLDAMKGGADSNRKGFITEADLEGYMMAHMGDLSIKGAEEGEDIKDEQLLSYSDLRGLCLSAAQKIDLVSTQFPLGSHPTLPGCSAGYAFGSPDMSSAEKRGVIPEQPQATEQTVARGTDYALILAGDTYEHWPKLNNPIHDAQTLEQELIQNYRYAKENIFYKENPTEDDIFDLLDKLGSRTFGPDDRLLVYVAGHGYMTENNSQGFIVTRETPLPAEDPHLKSALDLSRFRDVVDQLSVPHILVVLDVCYGGSFKDRKMIPAYTSENLDSAPSLDSFITDKMKPESRLYIASGGLRQAFDGEPGMHSPFARTFLKTLRQYGGQEHLIDAGKLEGAVEGLCPRPFYGTFGIQQEGGDFLFLPKPDARPVPDPGLDVKIEAPGCSS